MGKLSSERTYQRIAFVYLCFIIAATAMFFFLGLASFQMRRDHLDRLAEDKLELWGQRLAAEFERHMWALAEGALRDPELEALRAVEGQLSPPEAQALRAILARVRQRHPVARAFVLLESGHVRFPLMDEPQARPPRRAANAADLRAETVLANARRLLRSRRPDRAQPLFEQSRTLAESDWLKATADAGLADALRDRSPADRTVAKRAYERLIVDYGDLVDDRYKPVAVTGAIGLARIVALDGGSLTLPLAVLRDLRSGRWEVSGHQLESFTGELAGLLPENLVKPLLANPTEYLTQITLAPRILQEVGTSAARRIRQSVLPGDGVVPASQVFFDSLSPTLTVAFVADLQWAETVQLPSCQAEYPESPQLPVQLRQRQDLAQTGILSVPFRSVLDTWELHISRDAYTDRQSDLRQTASGLVLSSLMFLSVLGLALYLLLRLTREVQLSQVQTTFFSAFSHELKTPLTLIRLYTEILQGKEGSREEREGYYRIISRASMNLTKLIDGFQNFVLVRRNRMRFHLEEGDLGAAITETVLGFAEYLRRQDFEFEVELSKEPIIVELDGEAVSQAVLNLLENARKYSEERKFIAVRLWSDRESAILEIEDHGTGIADSEQEKIFEEFYRVDAPDRERSGFGLGLFLVRHIMLAHKGTVELDSAPGRGSRFRLIFPLAKPDRPAAGEERLVLQRGVSS